MKTTIPGKTVRQIRYALAMSATQFAAVLCVAESTVKHWEDHGDRAAPVNGLAAHILMDLERRLNGPGGFAPDLSQRVLSRLLSQGALRAIVEIIHG
jgi:hypothetical protein